MSQTLRRELRQKFMDVFSRHTYSGFDLFSVCEELADAALELRGVAMSAPKSLDWMIGADMSSEEIAAVNEKEQAERELLFHYEKQIGYGTTLDWWGKDKDLVDLRKFLVTQSKEAIETFAKWCNRPYAKFGPENAKRFPRDVMTFWPLAFKDEPNEKYERRPGANHL